MLKDTYSERKPLAKSVPLTKDIKISKSLKTISDLSASVDYSLYRLANFGGELTDEQYFHDIDYTLRLSKSISALSKFILKLHCFHEWKPLPCDDSGNDGVRCTKCSIIFLVKCPHEQ